jgi:hypothetical protein
MKLIVIFTVLFSGIAVASDFTSLRYVGVAGNMVVIKKCTEDYTRENLCTKSFFVKEGDEIPGEGIKIDQAERIRGRVFVKLSNGKVLERYQPLVEDLVQSTPTEIYESLGAVIKAKQEELGKSEPTQSLKTAKEQAAKQIKVEVEKPSSDELDQQQEDVDAEIFQ